MSRWLLSLLCLLLLLALTQFSNAGVTIRVNESATRVLLKDDQTIVSLAIENPLGRIVTARIRLELVDPKDQVRVVAEREESIKAGSQAFNIALELPKSITDESNQLLWYRLRYRLRPIFSQPTSFDPSAGLISLSQITPDIFELRVAAPQYVRDGVPYQVRAYAAHPITGHPVKDVSIAADLKFEGDNKKDFVAKQVATTGAEGYATFDFLLPRDIESDEGELKIAARRGLLLQEAQLDIRLVHQAFGVVNTDKPLYQPGQTVHTRLLAFDPSRHALVNEEVTFTISDPEDQKVFQVALKTSRFGVASVDWAIPDSTRLGDYHLDVRFENSKYEDSRAVGTIKISRYDLPNFTVKVKPDRSYYLPGQSAEVEVTADYLFGQPVKNGHLRVVRETERRWNYREQKWDTEEGDKYEGDTDSEGRFLAHIKLESEHQKLKDSDYDRYRDLSYAAYFTDPTTNRTEQRRFDLRISKNAIHVYVIEGSTWQASGFPVRFYLSTFYADGTPAQCEVAISEDVQVADGNVLRPLRTISTNRLGVAKIDGLHL
ncbi:MAG TPA: MG2 domain-containing protein, partial [Pyrinomonadaceae bacterium]|nr:MG2 domain-containing protein [Pyrinomonadaceae bacterium]